MSKMEVDAVAKNYNKMVKVFEGVFAYRIQETGKHEPLSSDSLALNVSYDPQGLSLFLSKNKGMFRID